MVLVREGREVGAALHSLSLLAGIEVPFDNFLWCVWLFDIPFSSPSLSSEERTISLRCLLAGGEAISLGFEEQEQSWTT